MEKIFVAQQQMVSFNAKLEIMFKATPLSKNWLVMIESIKIDEKELEGYHRISAFNERLNHIELNEKASQEIAALAGKPLKKGKTASIGVSDEVKAVYAEAYKWSVETRRKQYNEAFESLAESSKVIVTYDGQYIFINTESSNADQSEWIVKTIEYLKKLGHSFAENVLGTPTIVNIKDYSIERAWEITLEQLKAIRAEAERELEEIERKKAEKAAERESIRRAKFEEAARTGKPVELRRWTDQCDDPREECDIDSVIEYAMPDGSTKIERHHTW
jgi:hypothetical protein